MNEAMTAAALYSRLKTDREPYLVRAREAAKLTIPSLMPPEGSDGSTVLPTPYQSIGARGVNNLAAKLLLALFPPNQPIFKINIDPFTLEKITQQQGARGEMDKALSRYEKTASSELEAVAARPTLHEAFRQLVVSGNVLIQELPEGRYKAHRLDRYVVNRSPDGTVLQIVIEEKVAKVSLSDEAVALIGPTAQQDKGTNAINERAIAVYTLVERRDNKWHVSQEVMGKTIPSSVGTYPLDASAFWPVRWNAIDGEDYGRGHVEEYMGDLMSLEDLSRALVNGAKIASRLVVLVNPNGVTDIDDVTEADDFDVKHGREEDVSYIQAARFADFQVMQTQASNIEQRLAYAFLLNSAIQRPGERVTAEEIRYMARELEDALGGIYSLLSQELQLPLVRRLLYRLEKAKRLPALPKQIASPTIVTGLEALGRGHDLNRLELLMQGVAKNFGPQALAQEINLGEYVKRLSAALGVEPEGLVKSDEQKDMEQKMAQMQAMIQKLGPNAVNQLGQMAQQQQQTETQQ